jgi:hypothetical protein
LSDYVVNYNYESQGCCFRKRPDINENIVLKIDYFKSEFMKRYSPRWGDYKCEICQKDIKAHYCTMDKIHFAQPDSYTEKQKRLGWTNYYGGENIVHVPAYYCNDCKGKCESCLTVTSTELCTSCNKYICDNHGEFYKLSLGYKTEDKYNICALCNQNPVDIKKIITERHDKICDMDQILKEDYKNYLNDFA